MPDTFQSAVDKRLVPKAVTFDPDSAGYDDDTFNASGQKRDPINNHASSLDPRTGMVLKGRNHPTFGWTINAEAELGNTIVKAKDGRYYSRSKDKLAEGDEPIKLTEQEQQKAREAAATKVMEQGGKPNTFQSAIEKRLTAPAAAQKRYGYEIENPEVKKGVDEYFKKNTHVAGMVMGGGHNGSDPNEPVSIVSNPYNEYMSDDSKKEGLYKIEAARALMRDNPIPEFQLTPQMQKLRKLHFKPDEPYYSDDKAFRESLVSRVLANDLPKNLITPEMATEAKRFEQLLKERE